MEIVHNLINGLINTSMLEWFAFTFSIIYVFLATYQNKWCWLFAIISSSLYVYICFESQLYFDAQLQVYYVIISLLGWYNWNKPQKKHAIIQWKIKTHLYIILILLSVSIPLAWLFEHYTDQAYPYIDAPIFVFSIFATYLITIKVLENWIYFVFIDAISVFIFWNRGLEVTALLFIFYTFFALYGYLKWKTNFIQQHA
jgi:nicotinamide mononucleotide transporter